MNMIKKTDGFTLVELIVVIAILAILAAIAVPAYSGYITKANEAADLTQLDAIKTAASFAYMENAVKTNPAATDTEIIKLVVTKDGKVFVNDSADELNITTYYPTFPGFKSTTYQAKGATWLKTATGTLKAGWNATP